MRRLLLFVVPALLLVIPACAWYWLLHTESGAGFIVSRIESATGGRVRVGQVEGDFGSGVTLRDFELATTRVGLVVGDSRLVVDVDLLPPAIDIESATIRDAHLQLSPAPGDRPGRDARAIIRSLSLPFTVRAESVRIEDFRATGVFADRDLVVDSADLAGSWHESVEVRQLTLSSTALGTELSGSFSFADPFETNVTAELVVAAAYSPLDDATPVSLRAQGDLAELNVDVKADEAGAAVEGRLLSLLDTPAWDLHAALREFAHVFGERRTPLLLKDIDLETAGRFADYSFELVGIVETAGFAAARVTASGNGNAGGIDVGMLEAESPETGFTGSGRFAWGTDWFVESRLDVQRFELHAFLDAWPKQNPLDGELSLRLDSKHLAVRETRVGVGGSDMAAQVDAEIDFAASLVSGDVEWRDFRWPVAGDEAAVSSAGGKVSVEGSLEDWRIDGTVAVAVPGVPAGEFRIDGRGDRDHVEGEIVDSTVLGGRVAGHASYRWRGEQPWSAGIDLEGIDVGSLLQGWPGRVSGHADATGHAVPFRVDLRMRDISGQLRDGALAANGRIVMSGDELLAENLRLQHGDTHAVLDGDLYSGNGLGFDVAVDELARYIDDSAGALTASGRLSLDRENPSLRIDASSDALAYRGLRAEQLVVRDRSGGAGVISVEVTADNAVIGGQVFGSPVLHLVADAETQALDAAATFRRAEFETRVRGAFIDSDPGKRWTGELLGMDVELEDGTRFGLAEPAGFDVSASAVTVESVCLVAEPATRLCASTAWHGDTDFRINADFTDVPLALLNLAVDTRLEFDQLLNGSFHWRRQESGRSTGQSEIDISAGTIRSAEFGDVAIETGTGSLSFDIADGRLLTGGMQLPMPGFGHVDTRFTVHDVSAGADSAIEGIVDVDLADIALAAAFSSLIDSASGALRADVTIAGTLGSPRLSGRMSVTDGALDYLPIGLRLKDIDLVSTLGDDGRVEIAGTFQAGDGRGQLRTRADNAAAGATVLEFELTGQNLTVVDVPDVNARADVDITVAYDFHTVTLGGRVFITHARIRPQNLDVTRDTESEDIVVVAGELPTDVARRTRERRTQLAGALELAIGNDFVIDLNLATATMTGSTVFTWQNGIIPLGEGRYDLAGSVQAFGQVLDITEGALRFPRVSADNPFIRIRAEREIYGNSAIRTAGILVGGTARRPTIEAYTRPATTEERALALLVTGSDFDVEQGVGAVDFGTYIAPRLFVSYGVGLFERENVIRVRYDLSEGFGITATSGQKESGADLNYRFQR